MAKINIIIVGTEGNSVLVKYSSDKSKKDINDYEAVAFQPAEMGYDTPEEFLDGIRDHITFEALQRDKKEKRNFKRLNTSSWVGKKASYVTLDAPVDNQIVNVNAEVIL